MKAQQVGGDHYQSKHQHWDWVIDARVAYLEANATKYLSRWWKKGGPTDIEKADSYILKMAEAMSKSNYGNTSLHVSPYHQERAHAMKSLIEFFSQSDIPPNERGIIHAIAHWKTDTDLVLIRREINTLYMDACAGATTAGKPAGGTGSGAGQAGASGPAEGRVEHPAPFGYDGQG